MNQNNDEEEINLLRKMQSTASKPVRPTSGIKKK